MSNHNKELSRQTRGNEEVTGETDASDSGQKQDLPEEGSLFRSVREFLASEEETYGRFEIPEPPHDAKSAPEHSDASSDDGSGSISGSISTETQVSNTEADYMNTGLTGTTPAENSGPAAARTLDELFEICLAAEVLRTDLADTRLVFGTGNPDADLMLIGEAPGFQEDKEGEPFVGKAGQLLNKILEAISFRREDVYIANILKHRPPNNRDPHPEERERSLPYLYRQIELIQPKLILCLGRISAQTLLNTTEPMKNLRGRFHPFQNGAELLVTFHPAALLRNPAWKRDTWEDVQLLRKRYDELTGKQG